MDAGTWVARDEFTSGAQARELLVPLTKAEETLTVRELICRRVRVEMARGDHGADDIATEEARALEMFGKNRYFVLVGETQKTDLEEKVVMRRDLVVRFVKLTPLVGG